MTATSRDQEASEITPRRYRFRPVLLWIALGVVLFASTLFFRLPRSPIPDERILARAGHLETARVLERTVEAGTISEEIRLRSTSGLELHCLLQRPVGSPDPLPAVVFLGGYDRGRQVVRPIPKNRHPVVWVSFDYPYRVPESARRFPGPLREVPRIQRALIDSAAGMVLVHEYLEAREDVDPRRIVAGGASLGGYLAVIAGDVEPGFDGVVALYAGGDLERIVEGWVKVRSRTVARSLAASIHPWLEPLDPLHFAAGISPRPFLMINGLSDRIIPQESVTALFEAAGEPRRLVWIESGHRVLRDPDGLRQVSDTIYDWMEEMDLVPAAEPTE